VAASASGLEASHHPLTLEQTHSEGVGETAGAIDRIAVVLAVDDVLPQAATFIIKKLYTVWFRHRTLDGSDTPFCSGGNVTDCRGRLL
jgi:hypothetical protein